MSSRDAVVEPSPGNEPSGRRRVIAVIGIDQYLFHQKLRNGVSDARGVHRLFTETLGFVELVPALYDANATRDAIKSMIDEQLRELLRSEDELVVFFAGHGSTREDQIGGVGRVTGFLVPVEARPGHWNDYIKVPDVLDSINSLPARHVVAIIDACHSGVALDERVSVFRGGAQRYQRDLEGRVSRKVLTSAMQDQQAQDGGPMRGHSLFTGVLLDGIETHSADLDHNGTLTGSELGLYVQQRVAQASGAEQTPDFGTFGDDARGEMFIPIVHAARSAANWPGARLEPGPPLWRRRGLVALTLGLGAGLVALGWPREQSAEERREEPPPVRSDAEVLDATEASRPDVGTPTTPPTPPPCPGDMVLVPGGDFTRGFADVAELEAAWVECDGTCERPELERALGADPGRVEPLCMDRHEVTVSELVAWINEQQAWLQEDGRFLVDESGRAWAGAWTKRNVADGQQARLTMMERDARGRWQAGPGMEKRPAFLVSWSAADGFCEARGQRLPTELEWEYAARGAERRMYVWGQRELGCTDVVIDRREACRVYGNVEDVGWSTVDESWAGIFELGGNVSEWVAGEFEDPAGCPGASEGAARGCHVYKGGNWSRSRGLSQPSLRFLESPRHDGIFATIGFRCVQEPR